MISLYESEKLSTSCVKELAFVSVKRQEEILKVMDGCGDYGVMMARALVLKTPAAQRSKARAGTNTPWSRNANGQSDLLKKLKDAEQQQDFYSTIYRQYSINLLKLVVYVRRLLTNTEVRKFLDEKYRDTVAELESIIETAEGT
ncbi:hypothetical protein OAH18_01240 [bacterium]|nr:hypothetical protein [bacterium]